jgi:ketosteroid isomerase-like protein
LSQRERNMETTRRALDAFNRGALDEAVGYTDPEIEWHITFRLPDLPPRKRVLRGPEEVLGLWRAFTSVWARIELEIEEFLYADDERQVLRARFAGRGSESGIEVDRTVFLSYRLRDGKLIYSRAHDDEASARRDLGLDVNDG